MIVPRYARILRTLRKAREFMRSQGINSLPVDPFFIATKNGWGPATVGFVSEMSGYDRSKVISGEDGDSVWINGKYRIIYNEQVPIPLRIKWTIAHEIGHIVLGHFEDFDKTKIPRGALLDQEYAVLEKEANLFAAELLAPLKILQIIGVKTVNDIIDLCQITKYAASWRFTELIHESSLDYYEESYDFFTEQFSDYLAPVVYCSNTFIPHQVKFSYKHTKVTYMTRKHEHIRTDKNNRLITCPRCNNYNFSEHAKYCKMCGLKLHNICTDVPREERVPCGEQNPGDARFCEHCGQETVLFRKGLLASWQELRKINEDRERQLEQVERIRGRLYDI